MLSFRVFQFFLVYAFIDTVTSERVSYNSVIEENGNIPNQEQGSRENRNYVPSILKTRLDQIHNVKRRSPFLKPLKHVVEHVAGHVAEHLGFHRPHPGCEDRHFYPHHEFSFHHQHNPHFGQNLPHDFPVYHNSQEHDPPRYPETGDNKEHRYDFRPSGPEPDNDIPYRKPGISDKKDKYHPADLDHTTKNNKPAIYPPFDEEDRRNNTVTNFNQNKNNGDKSKVEDGNVTIESEFSGSTGSVKNNGSDSPAWVNPEDDVESLGSGEIPPTSKIDIRFRKN